MLAQLFDYVWFRELIQICVFVVLACAERLSDRIILGSSAHKFYATYSSILEFTRMRCGAGCHFSSFQKGLDQCVVMESLAVSLEGNVIPLKNLCLED